MTDRFRLASTFAQSLKHHQVPPAEVLRSAGLPAGLFQQEKPQVDTAQLFAFWRAVGEVSKDPAIGLKLSAEYKLERFNPTAIAAVCSRTFGDAVERMGRYKQLVCPEEFNLRPQGRETAVEFVFTNATESEPDVGGYLKNTLRAARASFAPMLRCEKPHRASGYARFSRLA